MPHALFDTENLTGASSGGARHMIPGIEPGGSRVGQPTKPALRITNLFGELRRFDPADSALVMQRSTIFLKLSQETDLTPGLILPVAQAFGASRTVGGDSDATSMTVQQLGGEFAGTIWAPRVVGWRNDESGVGPPTTVRWRIHLEYEMVDVEWMRWFLMWDFLDNITDNEEEF